MGLEETPDKDHCREGHMVHSQIRSRGQSVCVCVLTSLSLSLLLPCGMARRSEGPLAGTAGALVLKNSGFHSHLVSYNWTRERKDSVRNGGSVWGLSRRTIKKPGRQKKWVFLCLLVKDIEQMGKSILISVEVRGHSSHKEIRFTIMVTSKFSNQRPPPHTTSVHSHRHINSHSSSSSSSSSLFIVFVLNHRSVNH